MLEEAVEKLEDFKKQPLLLLIDTYTQQLIIHLVESLIVKLYKHIAIKKTAIYAFIR
jgi:hypothetical protein